MQREQLIDYLYHIEICGDKLLLDIVWAIGMKDQEQ